MNKNIFLRMQIILAIKINIASKFKLKNYTNKLKNSLSAKMISIPLTLSSYYYIYKKHLIENKTLAQSPVLKIPLPDLESVNEGEMREIKWGNNPKESFLLVKYNKCFHTLSNFCPHMGAPLHQGVLFDNIIKCPWHGASFDIVTGICDTYPSINGLIKHDIIKEGDTYYALIDTTNAKKSKIPEMAKRDPENKAKYVIIGGGPASLSCAENLRQGRFTGEIVIFSEEPYVTYDRTLLSKNLGVGINEIKLRDENFLKTYSIDYHSNSKVIGIENGKRIIKLSNGSIESYDKLLVATGASPKIPSIEGNNLNNVFILRNYNDLEKIKQASINAKNITIIGASFIGMELAGALKKFNPKLEITILDSHVVPFQKVLGNEIGTAIQKFYEKNGVKFLMDKTLSAVKSKNHSSDVDSIIYTEKTLQSEKENNQTQNTYDTDMVILGAGVTPNTEILESVVTLENNFTKCDAYMSTSDKNIFAAGDITSYPSIYNGERISTLHYVNAQQQGAIAALNMLGKNILYDYIPFYWVRFFDKTLHYVGNANSFDEVYIEGNLEEMSFIAYYIKSNKVVAFASMNMPNSANIMYESLRNNLIPSAKSIKGGELTLNKLRNILKNIKPRCARAECVCEARNKI